MIPWKFRMKKPLQVRNCASTLDDGSVCASTKPSVRRSVQGTFGIDTACYRCLGTKNHSEKIIAKGKDFRFLTGIHVVQQEWFLFERSRALVAFEGLLARMVPHVNLQILNQSKYKKMNNLEWLRNPSSYLQSLFQTKGFIAFRARIRFVVRVVPHVIQPRL